MKKRVKHISFMVGIDDSPEAVTGFELKQNYPNPFNPETNIAYRLEKTGNVLLEVFYISDRRIRELVNGRKTAGEHKASFQGIGLPSGIYFYNLTVDGETQTRKMTLLK